MSDINLFIDIHCQRPIWAIKHPNKKYRLSRYRIYVDEDLIVERDWIWEDNIFLSENIWINADSAKDHTLIIDPVVYSPEQAIFTIDNFKVVNSHVDNVKINDLQVNFTLR